MTAVARCVAGWRTAMGYGQIDLFLAALVLFDLTRPDTARRKGVAIGLAAGIKLTPAIFIAYLLITRRFRAAAIALALVHRLGGRRDNAAGRQGHPEVTRG